MKARSVREYAIAEVRASMNPLRGAQLVFESLLEMAAQRRLDALPACVLQRRDALRLQPGDGDTARGTLAELLNDGPRSLEELGIVNCFFAVGIVGAFLIDFINALLITQALNVLR